MDVVGEKEASRWTVSRGHSSELGPGFWGTLRSPLAMRPVLGVPLDAHHGDAHGWNRTPTRGGSELVQSTIVFAGHNGKIAPVGTVKVVPSKDPPLGMGYFLSRWWPPGAACRGVIFDGRFGQVAEIRAREPVGDGRPFSGVRKRSRAEAASARAPTGLLLENQVNIAARQALRRWSGRSRRLSCSERASSMHAA